jgi:hypothetical protein
MTAVAARRLAWGLLSLALAIATTGIVLVALNHSGLLEQAVFVVIFSGMALVGALIASRRPQNAIGWLLLGFTLAIALAFVGSEAAIYSFEKNRGAIPGARWLAWVGAWGWAAGIGPMITFVFLLFPDGHLPSRRWRPVAWVTGAVIVALVLLAAVDPQLDMPAGTSNPLAIETGGQAIGVAVGFGFMHLVVLALV